MERVLGHIESAKRDGARLLCGGRRPADPALAGGFFVEPTVFADVTPTMRIAREEIFGPVLAILPLVRRGAACWRRSTRSTTASPARSGPTTCPPRIAPRWRCEAGYVWINEVGKHFLGAPFGGVKQSGFGREECSRSCCSSRRRRTFT